MLAAAALPGPVPLPSSPAVTGTCQPRQHLQQVGGAEGGRSFWVFSPGMVTPPCPRAHQYGLPGLSKLHEYNQEYPIF